MVVGEAQAVGAPEDGGAADTAAGADAGPAFARFAAGFAAGFRHCWGEGGGSVGCG